VNSATVKIQGISAQKTAWTAGLAVGGSFLQGHTLLAYLDPAQALKPLSHWTKVKDHWKSNKDMIIKWDGQIILQTGPDAKFSPQPGSGIQFVRSTGGTHLPSKAVMDKACKVATHGEAHVRRQNCLEAWKTTDIYTFRLPMKVEIFVIAPSQRLFTVQLLIKMPPQYNQSGFCGNFNGKAEDDNPPGCTVGTVCNPRKSPGYFVEELDSLFSQESLSQKSHQKSSLMESPENYSATGDCVGEAFSKASDACSHLIDPGIRDGCIQDICTSGEVDKAMAAADEIAVIKAIQQDIGTMKECEPI